MDSCKRAYVEGFFPTDEEILSYRDTWVKWFNDKQNIIDSKWVSIDDWMGSDNPNEESSEISDNDFTVESSNSNSDIDIEKELSNNTNKQLTHFHSQTLQKRDFNETVNLYKHYFKEIITERLLKWEKNGLIKLLPPRQSRSENNWYDHFDSFKHHVKIKETRIISYTCESDDSKNKAKYRDDRGKSNKYFKNKSSTFKQYSYVRKVESNKTFEVNKIIKNKEYCSQNVSKSSRRNNLKAKKNRLNDTNSLYSSSSSISEKAYRRNKTASLRSRSGILLNCTYISSDDTDSDPDYKILNNVRILYDKVVNPKVVNSNKEMAVQCESQSCISNDNVETNRESPSNQCVPYMTKIPLSKHSEEDSEEDVLFMSNKKRMQLYGKCFVEQSVGTQSLVLYHRNNQDDDLDESSTDDGLFKLKNYKSKSKCPTDKNILI